MELSLCCSELRLLLRLWAAHARSASSETSLTNTGGKRKKKSDESTDGGAVEGLPDEGTAGRRWGRLDIFCIPRKYGPVVRPSDVQMSRSRPVKDDVGRSPLDIRTSQNSAQDGDG